MKNSHTEAKKSSASKHEMYSKILAVESIQNNLLQMYRCIFLTSESIIFSVAVFVATTPKTHFVFFLGIVGIYILWIMHKMTRKRGYAVYYCHLHLLKSEADIPFSYETFFTDFNKFMQWSHSEMKDYIFIENDGRVYFDRKTRGPMENLTFIFLALWVVLLCFTIW